MNHMDKSNDGLAPSPLKVEGPQVRDHSDRNQLEQSKKNLEEELETKTRAQQEIVDLYLPLQRLKTDSIAIRNANKKLNGDLRELKSKRDEIQSGVNTAKSMLEALEQRDRGKNQFNIKNFTNRWGTINRPITDLIDKTKRDTGKANKSASNHKFSSKINESSIIVGDTMLSIGKVSQQFDKNKDAIKHAIEQSMSRMNIETEDKINWENFFSGAQPVKINDWATFEKEFANLSRRLTEATSANEKSDSESTSKFNEITETHFCKVHVYDPIEIKSQNTSIELFENAFNNLSISKSNELKNQYESFQSKIKEFSPYYVNKPILEQERFSLSNDLYKVMLDTATAYQKVENNKKNLQDSGIPTQEREVLTNFLDEALQTTKVYKEKLQKLCEKLIELKESLDTNKNSVDSTKELMEQYRNIIEEFNKYKEEFDKKLIKSISDHKINFTTPGTKETISSIKILHKETEKLCEKCKVAAEGMLLFVVDSKKYAIESAAREFELRPQEDKAEFDEKFRSWIDLYRNCFFKGEKLLSALQAIDGYYKYVNSDNYVKDELKVNLEKWKTEQDTLLLGIDTDIDELNGKIKENKKKKEILDNKFQDLESEAEQNHKIDTNNNTDGYYYRLEKQYQKLGKEVYELTQDIEWAKGQLSSSKPTSQFESLRPVEKALKEANPEKQVLFNTHEDIAAYTENLRKVYHEENGTEMNIDHAIDTAEFFHRQKTFVKEEYIRKAAHLVKEFSTGLNSFYYNKEKFQIEIIDDPSKTKNNKLLSQLEFNENGDLSTVDGMKLKVSTIVSLKDDPYTWILSARSNELKFAPDTVMQQSGYINFEDLGKNTLIEAAQRECEEEAKGIRILPGTIVKVYKDTRGGDSVSFFKAEAEILEREATDTKTEANNFSETKGIWKLNVMDLIDKNHFHTKYDPSKDRIKIKEAILKMAHDAEVIGKPPQKRDQNSRGRNYYHDSYNVDHLVDCIEKCIPVFYEQTRELRWRPRGSEGNFHVLSMQPDENEK